MLVFDLKSESVKERHWKQIFEILKIRTRRAQTELTLGALYDAELAKSEKKIREVLTQAGGEMALEEFLKSIREYWTKYTLDFANY